jgi:hypothetical protein
MSTAQNGRSGLRLPDFIGVGPIRTATTWLHEELKNHVGLPLSKESRFFDWYYDRGLAWYADYFRDCPPDRPFGEFCPTYFQRQDVLDRIAHDVPNCKIIVTLRHPVERAYSQYKLLRHAAYIGNVSFEEALVLNPSIIDSSRYASHLVKWQERFGTDRVLVCLYDDLRANEELYLNRICDFIGVPHRRPVPLDKVTINSFESPPKNPFLARLALKIRLTLQNKEYYRTIDLIDRVGFFEFCRGRGERYAPVARETATRLTDQLRTEVEALERLINRDLSAWK